jgi:hypothetical protein
MEQIKIEICALPGYYRAYSDISLPTFREKLSGPILKSKEIQDRLELLTFEDETARVYRNVCKELPLYIS